MNSSWIELEREGAAHLHLRSLINAKADSDPLKQVVSMAKKTEISRMLHDLEAKSFPQNYGFQKSQFVVALTRNGNGL